MRKFSKKSTKEWWRSLTLEEQVEYRVHKMEELGKTPNRDEVYSRTLAENNYMK